MSKLFSRVQKFESEEIILTPEELDILRKELAQRFREVVFMTSEDRAGKMLESLGKINLETDDSITVNFQIHLVRGDILQIVGRERMKVTVAK
jgi:hypothetical protein